MGRVVGNLEQLAGGPFNHPQVDIAAAIRGKQDLPSIAGVHGLPVEPDAGGDHFRCVGAQVIPGQGDNIYDYVSTCTKRIGAITGGE